MTMETIVAGAVAAGGASVLGAFVNGLWNRRKLGAEATETITRAASGVAQSLQGDNQRLREEAAVLRVDRDRDHLLIRGLQRQLDELRRELEARDKWHIACQEFANDLIRRLRAHGETDLPTPPPVQHPTHKLPTPPGGIPRVPPAATP